MNIKKDFLEQLRQEIPQWVSRQIIGEIQEKEILALYESPQEQVTQEAIAQPEQKAKSDGIKRLPYILMGLAGVLLGVGMILFYAANWRIMPPWFKLAQVFTLVLGTYGTAFYLLAFRKPGHFVGRIVLLLGMVSFGVGIMLVAQIYHISAHPTNGVLVWAIGVLLTAWIAQEKWGYFLGAALGFVWNLWEFYEYANPNLLFFLFPLVLNYLFYTKKSPFGILVGSAQLIFWFYQVNLYFLFYEGGVYIEDFIKTGFVFHLLHLPLGLSIVCLFRFLETRENFRFVWKWISLYGWACIFWSMMSLSWPMNIDVTFPTLQFNFFFLNVEYGVFTLLSLFLLYVLFRQKQEYLFLSACAFVSVFLPFLPLGHGATLIVITHLGLLAFLFGWIYFNYAFPPVREHEKGFAFVLLVLTLIIKGVGLMSLGVMRGEFMIAYGVGFLIFATVCFLLNQWVELLLTRKQIPYPSFIFNSIYTFTVFFLFYALSFELPTQFSFLGAKPLVLTLVFLFLGLAFFLYGILWMKSKDKSTVITSGTLFLISVFTLLVSGPEIYPIIYTLIFNFLLLLMVVVLLFYSAKIHSRGLANVAITGFLLQIITRYFDVFWDLLSGSLLFIITGLIFLGGGWFLEKNRRKLMERIISPQPTEES